MKNKILILCAVLVALLAAPCLSACGDEVRPWLKVYDEPGTSSLADAEDALPAPDADTVLYYKFNEGSGGRVRDETGRHDGVLLSGGADSRVPGKYGNALSFKTNRNRCVYVEDAPDLTPASLTIEMIVKFDASSRFIAFQRLLFKDWAYNVFLENTGTPYLRFNLYSETNTAWEVAKVTLNGEVFDGKFHHIAFTYDGTTGLTRAYFDYYCEDSNYLSPGLLMPSERNYPLYVGAGYWAERVQQASTVVFDTLRISARDRYATEFIGSPPDEDNYLAGLAAATTTGELVHDITFAAGDGGAIRDADGATLGSAVNPRYTGDGLHLKQGVSEASFSVDADRFGSGDLSVETIVTLDPAARPDEHAQKDGTVLYKADDFMICTYVFDAGGGRLGYLVTFRINLDRAARLISEENQMCVDYHIYDGKPHHLALNYCAETATMEGYIDYRKVISKSFANAGLSDYAFRMSDSPVLVGRSLYNWQGDGWYRRILLRDGTTAVPDMAEYANPEDRPEIEESGDAVAEIAFDERAGGRFSLDRSPYGNDLYLIGGAALAADGERKVLDLATENADAAYIPASPSLNGASVTIQAVIRLGPGLSDGLHRLVFKDGQYDLGLEVKSGRVALSVKLNTQRDGWLTRAKGSADALADGGYHTVVMTYAASSGVVRLYLDGVALTEERWGGDLVSGGGHLYVGAGYWDGALRQGSAVRFDALTVYNYALSQSAVGA